MLITAPYSCGCRGCASEIRAGTRISWVEGTGPYHIGCSPLHEDIDAARREAIEAERVAAQLRAEKAKIPIPTDYTALISATAIAELLLLGAIALQNPHAYYTLLRLVISGLSVFLAFRLFTEKRAVLAVVLGFVALLYNPLLPIHFPRELWRIINVATIPLLAAALFLLHPRKRT